MSKETKKEKKANKKAAKAEKKANKGPMAPETKQAWIQSATAVICTAAICISGSTAIDKAVSNMAELAKNNTSVSDSADVNNDVTTDDNTATDNGATNDNTIAEDNTVADDNAAADNSVSADNSSSSGTGSSTGSSNTGKNTPANNKKAISLTSGLSSSDKNEVYQYYKLVANHNKKKPGQYLTKMTLESLNGGSGAVGSLISAIEPIGKKALAKNSTAGDNIPGTLETLKASDWQDAKAVNDGKFTTITINVVPQTDGANGKDNQGTVGRSIGVLDGVQTALDEMGGAVSADFANGKFALKYDHAYIKIKVNNATGDLVKGSCTWHHQVNVIMDELDVKVTLLSATIKGGKAIIDYSVTY
ncbi:MAG: hypothetical protein KBT46_07160 [Ruminococcus sp.]|nr:hypothetical protein [Candidatus Copronaster equi]